MIFFKHSKIRDTHPTGSLYLMNLTWKRQRSPLELQGLKNEEKYTKCYSQKKAGVSYLTFQQFHEDRATSPNIQTETHPCSEIQRLWTQKPGHMCLSTNAKCSYQNHFAIIQDELENPLAEDGSLFPPCHLYIAITTNTCSCPFPVASTAPCASQEDLER